MNVEVKLFAAAREMAGAEAVQVSVSSPTTIGTVRAAMCREHPGMAALIKASLFALDAHYSGDDAEIAEGAEVACIPPVSGG